MIIVSNASSLSASGTASRQSFVQRNLDFTEILGEVLFGLIMVLTFSLGAGLIVEEGAEATNWMQWGILGMDLGG